MNYLKVNRRDGEKVKKIRIQQRILEIHDICDLSRRGTFIISNNQIIRPTETKNQETVKMREVTQ
jgi:hypothetical protein